MPAGSSSQNLEAFEKLYRGQSGRVLLMFVRLCGSLTDGEDLTQETFLRAWRSWPTFRFGSSEGTWLHRIALRTYADWRRARSRRIDEANAGNETAPTDIGSYVPDADFELEDAISQLPAQMREAFVLHYIEGFALTEIAHRLGKSSGTLKAQLHAARNKLRAVLGT